MDAITLKANLINYHRAHRGHRGRIRMIDIFLLDQTLNAEAQRQRDAEKTHSSKVIFLCASTPLR